MEEDRNPVAEKILDITLEIISLLTGEDHVVVKKYGERAVSCTCPRVSDGPSRIRSSSSALAPHFLLRERHNEQEILALTHLIIQLLTGEVPVRCEDVTVYLSMKEWEYLEGHKELYQDVLMEDHPPLHSIDKAVPDGFQICNSLHQNPEIKEDTVINPSNNEKCLNSIQSNDIQAKNIINKFLCDPDKTTNCKSPLDADYTEPMFTCSECEKCFTSNSELIKHRTFHAENTLVPSSPVTPREEPFSCSKCGENFHHVSQLVKHHRIHVRENPISCSECGKQFTKKARLVTHQKIHTGDTSGNPYTCGECGKCFTRASNLTAHRRIHTGEKPFKCNDCGKCFTEASNLIAHRRRIHTGEKKYKCNECGKCFTQTTGLKIHIRTHTGEKPYKCTECGKCFSDASGLITHRRIHSGEKTYKCDECGKCFTQASGLTVHRRTHTGKKQYECKECGKCFIQASNLKAHRRTHTGE